MVAKLCVALLLWCKTKHHCFVPLPCQMTGRCTVATVTAKRPTLVLDERGCELLVAEQIRFKQRP
jgi:hypothetical protein